MSDFDSQVIEVNLLKGDQVEVRYAADAVDSSLLNHVEKYFRCRSESTFLKGIEGSQEQILIKRHVDPREGVALISAIPSTDSDWKIEEGARYEEDIEGTDCFCVSDKIRQIPEGVTVVNRYLSKSDTTGKMLFLISVLNKTY